MKHTDNSCNVAAGNQTGQGDNAMDGATTILYLNEGWVEADGGTLRIFEAHDPTSFWQRSNPNSNLLSLGGPALPARGNAATQNRYAVTMWYFDGPRIPKGNSDDEEDIAKRKEKTNRSRDQGL